MSQHNDRNPQIDAELIKHGLSHDQPSQLADAFRNGYRAAEAELQKRVAELERWREAVIDGLIISHIYAAAHDTDPRKVLADLIAWETQIALDPAVSSEAQALIDKGRQAASVAVPEDERKFLEWVSDTLIELNPSNYGHEDACACSAASVEVILAIKQRLSATPQPAVAEPVRIYGYVYKLANEDGSYEPNYTPEKNLEKGILFALVDPESLPASYMQWDGQDTKHPVMFNGQSEAETSATASVAGYAHGEWFKAQTIDEMQAFYMARLPAIRDVARFHGYAIGLHGSTRRDFDLIATPWVDEASDKNVLAHAIAMAACGITRNGEYQWESKPNGRYAVSIPICWANHANPDFDKPGVGHIDLSVVASKPAPLKVPSKEKLLEIYTNAAILTNAHAFNIDVFAKAAELLLAEVQKGGE